MMEIIQRLIPTQYTKIRPHTPMAVKYITVHETANTRAGADAMAHARLLERGNTRVASWHFTVDSKQIIQHVPTNEIAYHAGDGLGPGNSSSVGIEICVNEDGDFALAKKNAAKLIRYLMDKHGIPIERVVPHNKWTGKDCPHTILKEGWSPFILLVLDQKPEPKWPGYLIRKGSRGEAVKIIQKRLGGLDVDGIFGPKTDAAVKAFQKLKKIKIDGIVGPITWSKMFP